MENILDKITVGLEPMNMAEAVKQGLSSPYSGLSDDTKGYKVTYESGSISWVPSNSDVRAVFCSSGQDTCNNKHNDKTPKIICIDIDGTICHYDGWIGEAHFGEVLPGASEFIRKLHNKGWFIVIYSTRSNKLLIKDFLDRNGIYFDAINEHPYQPENAIGGKPIADIYLDDRAITFKGFWDVAYEEITKFKTWE